MKQMKQKHWQVSVFDKTSEIIKDDTFYTTDTEAYLVFELIDEDFIPDSAMITVYNIYGTAIINVSVEVVDGIARYEMPEKAIRHRGGWRTQAIFTKDGEDYTTRVIEFDVGGHLLDSKKPPIIEIENWNRFIEHAGELIDDWEQLEEIRQTNEQQRESAESARQTTFETNESTRQSEFETNETGRQANELIREEAEGNRQSTFEENELARESAESVRVANEAERISKDSERDSKIEAFEGLQADLISGAVDSAAVQQHVEERYGQLEEEYAPKLTEVTTQLAQTKSAVDSVESANSSEILQVKNYLGNYQNTHPKVLYFENGWNGYKYWMGYTPYPNGATSSENPCIAVSNDMITWTVPTGLTNPLDPGDATNYNSDTHLVYRNDTNTMEIWWRQRRASDGYWLIYRRKTIDGVNWTEKELVLENSVTDDTMSPSIIFEDGRYKIWYVSHATFGGGTGRKLGYMESNGDTITSWSGRSIIPVEWESTNASIWHVDVIKSELGYELLFSARYPAGGSNTALFHAVQKADGTTTTPKLVIARNTNAKAIDSYGIYRSSFIKVGGVYHVFYAPVKQDANGNSTEFYLSLSSGMDITGLNGYKDLVGYKKVLTLTDAGEVNISKEDAEYYDAIRIMGNTETTINMIHGGVLGKKLTIFLGGTPNALKCKINHWDPYLLMPLNKPYILSRQSGTTSVDLVCYNIPERWRTVGTDIPPIIKNKYITTANEVLTDFDITNYDTIEITGTGVVINSLIGGYGGKVIHIYAQNVAQSATLTYSSRLKVSGASDVMVGRDRMGVTAICQNYSNNNWIVF